jgi:hypothetical protein
VCYGAGMALSKKNYKTTFYDDTIKVGYIVLNKGVPNKVIDISDQMTARLIVDREGNWIGLEFFMPLRLRDNNDN